MWVPRDKVVHIQAKEKHHLVKINAHPISAKAHKQYIVPTTLLIAQGYYNGQQLIWVPRTTQKNPTQKKSKPMPVQILKVPQQWRPKQKGQLKSDPLESQSHIVTKSLPKQH